MDLLWTRAHAVIVLLSLVNYIQGNPITQTQTKALDSKINTLPLTSEINRNGESNDNAAVDKNSVNNDQHKGVVIDNGIDTNALNQQQQQQQHSQPRPQSTSFLDPMALTGEDNSKAEAIDDGGNDISKDFTQKVLLAFFDELKKRPDLVDEIVRRETYRLLMDSGMDEDFGAALPIEPDMTQELLPISDLENGPKNKNKENADDSSNMKGNIKSVNVNESNISKKNTQNGVAQKTKSQPNGQGQIGDNSVDLKSQTALTKGLGGVSMPGLAAKSDILDTGDADSSEDLNPSYYYYVYYDENEDTTAKPTDASGENNVDGVKPSVDNKVDDKRTNAHNIMDATNAQDTVIEKLASAVRSVISRDMENQLDKNKLTLGNGSGRPQDNDIEATGLKATSQALGNSKDNVVVSDDEMELQKLAE